MRPPEDEALLRDMLDHARRAVGAVAKKERLDLESDYVLAAALERFIEVIGEAATKLSEGTKAGAPQIPWREIIGMRNLWFMATPRWTTTSSGMSCREI